MRSDYWTIMMSRQKIGPLQQEMRRLGRDEQALPVAPPLWRNTKA
jgi:hypothetical protein